jgi:hypothetical protein
MVLEMEAHEGASGSTSFPNLHYFSRKAKGQIADAADGQPVARRDPLQRK